MLRKVKEHHKKKAKEAKKLRATKRKPNKVLKDPGIPSSFPYKEQFMKEMAFEQKRILDRIEHKKQEKKRMREVSKLVDLSACLIWGIFLSLDIWLAL